MKKTLAVVCAGIAALSGANAQQEIANPTSTIDNFDPESIGPVLRDLGVAWQAQKNDKGQSYVIANAGGVLNFILAPAACRNNGVSNCTGLNMLSVFDGNPNPQTVRAFNNRYAFARAGIDPSGAAYISRYEISDYGMARGNLATSIQVFVIQAVALGSELETARHTVSLEGYADDLAAKELNRQGLSDMTGVEFHATNPIDLHQQGLEDSAIALRQFILDKSAPRNKIENIAK